MGKYIVKEKTKEALEEELEDIKEQESIFDLEQKVKGRQIAFREKVLKQLEEDVTLDEILEEMAKKSLCKKISVWVTTDY